MIKDVVLKHILEIAVHAPSGDNTQPWQFKIKGDTISIFNLNDRDETLYNFRQRGSYIGHGALLENILIAASHECLAGTIVAFPGEPHCTACISFAPATVTPDPLLNSIEKRATNRKPYKTLPLANQDKSLLLESVRPFKNVEFRLLEDRGQIEALAVTLSLNERLLMENRELHDFLFGVIRWTHRDELRTPGLYIKTMEFPLPVRILMRHVLRRWSAARALNKIGLSKAIAKESAALYRASAAFGAVIISDDSDASFLEAGRAFERIWLSATRCGLSLQPTTALPYLAQRIDAGQAGMFSSEHRALITEANNRISTAFKLDGTKRIAMLFRTGLGDKPTAGSVKLGPVLL